MARRTFCVAWPRWKERHMATSEKVESKKPDGIPAPAAKGAPAAPVSADRGAHAAEPAMKAVPAAPPARERDTGRDKAIDLAVSTIEKQFGKGSIMRLGEGIAP